MIGFARLHCIRDSLSLCHSSSTCLCWAQCCNLSRLRVMTPDFSAAGVALGAALLFCIAYHKGLPGVWHTRFFLLLARELLSGARLSRLDERVSFRDRVWLSDLDFNLHLNNAHYNIR